MGRGAILQRILERLRALLGGADDSAERIALVDHHIEVENAQNMAALLDTFGTGAKFVMNGQETSGRDGNQALYQSLYDGFPDLHSTVARRYVAEDAIILETVLTGTHQGTWNGIPPTGRKVTAPMCAIFPFDAQGKLAAEIVYFDSAQVLMQLGVIPVPG